MTVTETEAAVEVEAPPSAETSAAGLPGAAPIPGTVVPESILTSSDHKRIGLAFIALSLIGFFAVRGIGAALGFELTDRGVDIVGGDSIRLYSFYDTGIVLLVLQPLWAGLATFFLPLQIGATRLVFPRAQALALWTYLVGGGLFVLGHAIDPPPGIGLSSPEPLQAPIGGINDGTNLIIASFGLLALSSLIVAGNLLATALTLRTDGMTLRRMPLFAWGVVAASIGTLLATPAFVAGVLILYMDLHFGGFSVFAQPGAAKIWQHTMWLYGRPEIILLSLPALGAAGDIVTTAARTGIADPPQPPVPASLRAKAPPQPPGHSLAFGSLVAIAILSFLTLAQGQSALRAIVLPTAGFATALVVLPLGQLVLLWLGTLGKARARPTLAVGFVAAALLVIAAAAVNAIIAGFADVTGTAFRTGSIELVALGVPTILGAGALCHWGKKLFGAPLSGIAGGLVLLLLTGGTLALGFGWLLAGYSGASAHLKDWTDTDLQGPFVLAAVGHGLLLAGGLVLVLDIIRAMVAGSRAESTPPDLDDGPTLEWATPTPVPPGNFEEIPDVRSPTPVLDLAQARKDGKA